MVTAIMLGLTHLFPAQLRREERVVFRSPGISAWWGVESHGFPTAADYLNFEFKISSCQRFWLRLRDEIGTRSVLFQPYGENRWLPASIPLSLFDQGLTDLRPRRFPTFWISDVRHAPSTSSTLRVGTEMRSPLGSVTLSVRYLSIRPKALSPPNTPLIDEFGRWKTPRTGGLLRLDQLRSLWSRETSNPTPSGNDVDVYGGHPSSHRTFPSTVTFSIQRDKLKWWLVTPSGNRFLSIGCNGLHDYSTSERPMNAMSSSSEISWYAHNLKRRYGPSWSVDVRSRLSDRLRHLGFNTGPKPEYLPSDARLPYFGWFDGWLRLKNYAGMPDVYTSDFQDQLLRIAKEQCGPHSRNPWIVGYFYGHEPPWIWNADKVIAAVRSEPTSPAFQVLESQYNNGDTRQDRQRFVLDAFRRLATLLFETQKQVDPNHLSFGFRLTSGKISASLLDAVSNSDVLSTNLYARDPTQVLREIGKTWKGPILITEFHFGSPSSGLAPGLVGVIDQKARADAYTSYVRSALRNPSVIGYHWFQWIDEPVLGRGDGENYNIGFVDVTDRPYPDLWRAASAINHRAIELHTTASSSFR